MAELIGACAAGDRPAFRRLYDLSSRFVCGIIRAILRDKEMVAEVAQEVYVSIWQRADSFDDERRNPLAWIAAIARNRALDRLRAEFEPRTWDLFRRFVVDGSTADEVAAEFGTTPNAVYIAKSRVLARLREEATGLLG